MFPLPAPTSEPNISKGGEPPSGEEAKAKAHEMKSHEAEAKAKAAKEGKPTTEEGPKPVSISVPATPQPKSASHATPASKGKQKGTTAKPGAHPPGKGEPTAKNAGHAPGKGPGATGAKGDVDAEVAAYIAKAPKDTSKEEVHKNVKSLADGAKALQANCPPAAKGDGAVMSTLKMIVPGMDSIGAKPGESDMGKIMGAGANPYDQFDGTLKTWGGKISRVRDVVSGVSSILGKVGMVLTVVGLLISLTGIGAPLGGPIAAIGRVLGIITLVLDVITFIMSGILTAMVAMELAKEPPPNPEMRAKLAGQLLSESSQTFQALVSVALALPGVGKLAGAAAGGLKKVATGIAKMVGKFVGKVGMGIAKGIGKIIAASFNKLKTVFGSTLVKSGPGFFDKALSVGSKAVTAVEKVATGAKNLVGKGGAFLAEKVNGPLERALGRAENTAAGRAGKYIDGKAIKFNEALDKWTGKNLIEKGERSVGYYTTKLGARADVAAEKGAMGAESKMGAKADKIQHNAERAAQKNTEEQAAKAAKEAETKATREAAEKEAELKAAQDDAAKAGKTVEPAPAAPQEKAPAEKPPETVPSEGGAKPTEAEKPPEAGAKPADPAADPNAKDKKSGWDDYMDKRKQALDSAKAKQEAATKSRMEQEKTDTKAAADREKSDLDQLRADKASPEEIARQERRVKGAEKKADRAETAITSKEANEEAAKRAESRLNDARDGKNAEGEAAAGISDADKAKSTELKDSTHWEDPKKEGIGGLYAEKLGEPLELKKSQDEANNEWKKDLAGEAAKETREEVHEESQEGREGGTIAEFEAGGEGTLSSSVHGMLGDLDAKHDDKHGHDDHDHGHGHGHGHDEHGQAAPHANAPHGNAPGADPGHAPAAAHGNDGHAGPEAKGGAAPGALPYWPELLKEYQGDLGILGQTEGDLQKYREAQIAGYKSAVGIKDASDKEKQKAVARKPQTQSTKQGAADDGHVLQATAAKSTDDAGKAQEGTGKQGEASGAGSEGAAAAGTPVPPLPSPHWYDAILNVAKQFIVNYLAKALKFVQDWFTDKIIRLFTGGKLNLEKVNEMAHGTGQQTAADAGKSKGTEGTAGQAEGKDKEAEAKAEENKSTAQKLHDQCVNNVASADELLQTIAQLKTLITGEIKAGEAFLKDLREAKEKEKHELAAKEAQKKKEEEQKAATAKKEHDAHAHGDDHGHGKDKDHADPAQVGRVKGAANAVATGATAYHQRVTQGFQHAKSALSGEKGNKKLDHEVVEHAIQAYEQHAGEAVTHHQQGTEHRVTKMKAVAGKGQMKASELHTHGSEIEEAAKEADESLRDTLMALKHGFEASYKAQHKAKAHKAETHDHPAHPPQANKPQPNAAA